MALELSPNIALESAVSRLRGPEALSKRKLDNLLQPLVEDLARATTPEQARAVLAQAGQLLGSLQYQVPQDGLEPRSIAAAGQKLAALGRDADSIDAPLFEGVADVALATGARVSESEVAALGDLSNWVLAHSSDPMAAAKAMRQTVAQLLGVSGRGLTAGARKSLQSLDTSLKASIDKASVEQLGTASPETALADVDSFRMHEAVSWILEQTSQRGHIVGVPGVLDDAKLDRIEQMLAWSYTQGPKMRSDGLTNLQYKGWPEDKLELVARLMPQLRDLATQVSGGTLQLHATALQPDSIPNAAVRKSAEVVAQKLNLQRTQDDSHSLNFAEVTEALRLLNSKKSADVAAKNALVDAFGRAVGIRTGAEAQAEAAHVLASNLGLVRDYLKHGKNGLLSSGQAEITVGERKRVKRHSVQRRVPFFQLPDANGSLEPTVDTDAKAQELVEAYRDRLEKSQMDLVVFRSDNKLYVAVNPHGDLEGMWDGKPLQLYDYQGKMRGEGKVIEIMDPITSWGETHLGWYRKALRAASHAIRKLTNPNKKGTEVVQRIAENGLSLKKGGGMGFLAAAGAVAVAGSALSQLPELIGVAAAVGSIPAVVNIIDYMTSRQSLTPIEGLMGVTVSDA